MKPFKTDTGDRFTFEEREDDFVLYAWDAETEEELPFALYPSEARKLAKKLVKLADKLDA